MAPRNKSHRAATAIMAATMLGGLQARPAAAHPASSADDRAFSQSIARWLDERFGDPWRPSVTRVIDPYTAQTSTQDRGVRRYDIPAGPLETVLAAYQSASGVTVTFPADLIRGITSAGVSGMLTAEQALAQTARGTSLTFRFTAPFAAVVEIRIAASRSTSAATARAASPKYTEPLRDTPQTITVIPQALMEEQARDDAARRAAQRAGHHDSGRRRRHARRRPDGDPRLQRAHRHLHRRRPRLRRLLARRVQSRAGRSDEGARVGDRRAAARPAARSTWSARRRRCRPTASLSPSGGNADYKRGTLDVNQPMQRTRRRRASPQRHVEGRRHARPRRRGEQALGRRAVARLRPRHADR